MRKRSTQAFALFGATALLASGGVAPALAAGAVRASGVQYKGKTSQGLLFELTKSKHTIDMDVEMKAKCKSGPVKSVKLTGANRASGTGHLSGGKFSGTGGSTYPASGYMAVYQLKFAGKLSSSKVSGTFSVDNTLYNVTTGKKVGTCNTGKQTFKGHKA